MSKQPKHKRRPVRRPKSERDLAVESYAARLKSMGADQVLLDRIEKFQADYRASYKAPS